MRRPLKVSTRLALVLAAITMLIVFTSSLVFFSFYPPDVLLSLTPIIYLAITLISVFVVVYFYIQWRLEVHIYNRVKEIYDDVSFIEATQSSNPVTTDMNTLVEEVRKSVNKRKIEIETLKDQDAFRKEYLGNVAHELKTPLFTVQGYILTLLDGAIDDKEVRKKYLNRANKGVERLVYIVRDLDLLNKLETGIVKMEIGDFDIVELVSNVMELLEMRASKLDITVEFDRHYSTPILVRADKERIQQVLTNLLENSLKYGKSGGTTEVSIEALTEEKVIVRVTDNGEGIDKKDIPRLFERFYRVDKSGSRREGGSGLGLSIVKHIIENHKEKIFVESKLGIGSEFSFTLQKSSH